MFNKVLIANRGAIACRILRTLKRLGVHSVAVYSDVDRHSQHVLEADEAVRLGPAPAADSYLRQDLIIAAALKTGAQALHPGYGFLSENAGFAEKCEVAGIAFIGPTPQQMRDFGLKHTARALALQHDVPLLPGSELLDNVEHAVREAARIGFPIMLKSTAGGGGIGMQLCRSDKELTDAFHSVERLARSNFSQGGVFLEKYVERARHIEVQIFGDGRGNVVSLGERDCSVQRRNQKVIEETPAPHLDEVTRSQLLHSARRLGEAIGYRSAGTVEFVYDDAAGQFYFLEVNTRLQVEHGVTEQVTGIDLVEWMIRVAAGEPPDLSSYRHAPQGHSIQVRLYAEDPAHNFRPSSGLLSHVELPQRVRVDSWIEAGTEVSPHYDPMLAKIIATGATRAEALANLDRSLSETRIYGIETNQAYLQQIVRDEVFVQGRQFTRYLADLRYQPRSVEVLQPGTHSTVQDFPGRVGYWDIGVPPSGPMDDLAFRLINRVLGNRENAAGLEFTVSGPTLRFNSPAVITMGGANMQPELDGVAVGYWTPITVKSGSTLKLKSIQGTGQRAYLAIQGGFDVPHYMGSAATFTLGQFGGHAGRALRAGDTLRIKAVEPVSQCAALPAELVPAYDAQWDIAVMYGPHAAPEFFTDADIEAFFAATWEVHYNSSRTGVRLIGPKPQWARADGGEAGLHPSNIHDNAYAIGAIDFTGDMPVILGPDGPSLGGFVCPATIVRAELWKIGQLRPGDTVKFHCVSVDQAVMMEKALDEQIAALDPLDRTAPEPLTRAARDLSPRWVIPALPPSPKGEVSELSPVAEVPEFPAPRGEMSELPLPWGEGWGEGKGGRPSAILALQPPAPSPQPLTNGNRTASSPPVLYRQAGDKYLLVEYGAQVLDLELRFRVHSLMEWLQRACIDGVLELTPGIRSLQIHYDSRVISQRALLTLLERAETELPAIDDIEVASRIVHLPLSWDDPATRLAIEKYAQSVRKDAPWCPSNIEFIRRINGLESIEEVQRVVFDASYLVMGLGDVYLGAPVATPLDPRHRLVTTKYNPARTWTPENAVGIGGAYLCVYGMEGPGGYQFVGRTVQMWNRYRQTADFTGGRQWLLRFFDQLRFYPVSAEELLLLREDFVRGQFQLKVEPAVLRLREYRDFLATNRISIDQFKTRQQAAFDAERERWRVNGQLTFDTESSAAGEREAPQALPAGATATTSPVTGNVWTVAVRPGQRVQEGDELLVIEAMKMEIPIRADEAGEVIEIRCEPGKSVVAGDVLVVLRRKATDLR